jgi:hypothetical protein
VKTLADNICEAATDRRLDPFTRGLCDHAARQIRGAQRFVIELDAHDATRDLLRSRPSSLLEACSFARPPFEKTWIEWPSPDQPEPKHLVRVRTKRIGALIEAAPGSDGRAWSFWTAWSYDPNESEQRRKAYAGELDVEADLRNCGLGISASEAAFDYDCLKQPSRFPGWIEPLPHTAETIRGSIDDRYNNLRHALKEPRERQAVNTLLKCLRWRLRHDQFSVIQQSVTVELGAPAAVAMLDDVRDEVGPLLGMLILMNSRNCVDVQRIEPDPGLVKARLKRGNKPPPLGFSTVHIRLSRTQQNVAAARGLTREEMRQHKVRGHFKVRHSGVFWWHPHERGNPEKGRVDHGYQIDP